MKFFWLLLPIFSGLSCATDNAKTPKTTPIQPATKPEIEPEIDPNEPFYPYVEYIQQQIAHIDTTPYPMEKLIYINEKLVDSSYISKQEFANWASGFIDVNPNTTALKPHFSESSLKDLTLNRIIFSITAKEPNSKLLQADVSINPQNEKVKTVVLKKQMTNEDSTVLQHLVWVDGKHFQISETISPVNKETYLKVIKIIWDKDLQ